MVVEAGRRGSSSIFLLTEAGGRDQQWRPSWRSGAKPPGDLEAAHLWQIEVEEDDFGLYCGGHLQGRMTIVRHTDLLILKQEDMRKRLRRIDVVVDHENTASNRVPSRAGCRNGWRLDPNLQRGQSNDELAALATTGAADLDVPAVELDQTLHERQPDAKAALRMTAGLELPEGDEHAFEHLGGKAEAVVGDRQCHLRIAKLHGELDTATVRGVFRRIVEEIRQNLTKTNRVSVNPHRIGRNAHR